MIVIINYVSNSSIYCRNPWDYQSPNEQGKMWSRLWKAHPKNHDGYGLLLYVDGICFVCSRMNRVVVAA